MSKRVNAVVAMDGDYYADHPNSFVLRQGVLFRNVKETYHDLLLIDEDGDFHVILAGNRNTEPAFMMVLCGVAPFAYKREDGVYVVPVACLKD